ncbi:MAG: flavodoxin domain-containing protein [Patescibacteria group bacterium]|nr:flavodoxin domain-containing protein [Patescibacteria group bacterium]
MANVLLVYGSTTGNTEMAAEQIAGNLSAHQVETQDVADTTPEDLEGAKILVLGSSTWGAGLLQQDFRDFAKDLSVDLSGKKIAVFGLGDTNYPDFCEAATILEKKVVELGGKLVVESLRVDGFPDEPENESKIDQWSEELNQTF